MDIRESGYTLSATASGLTGATSAAFAVAPGTAPSTLVNAIVPPAVTVDVLDVFNNPVTTYVGSDAVGIGTNPSGAMLAQT